jgi:hypothetical protein
MLEPALRCPECPEFGICVYEVLVPEKGYARFHLMSEVFVRCFYKEACQDGTAD